MEEDDPEVVPEEREAEEAEEEEDGTLARRLRAQRQRPPSRKRTAVKLSPEELQADLAHLRRLRGRRTLSEDTIITIVHAYLATKLEDAEKNESRDAVAATEGPAPKRGKRGGKAAGVGRNGGRGRGRGRGRTLVRTPTPRERVRRLLGFSSSTISMAFSRWNKAKAETGVRPDRLSVPSIRGQGGRRTPRVPNTKGVLRLVRDFLHGERAAERRVTATQVLAHLRSHNIITIKQTPLGGDDPKDYDAAHRATRRFLSRAGFMHGRKLQVREKSAQRKMLRDYLKALLENRSQPPSTRLREVYLDESYVDSSHNHDGQSLFHPDDPGTKAIGRGKRLCFALAIQGQDPTLERGQERQAAHWRLAGVVPQTFRVFDPSAGKRQEKRDRNREKQQLDSLERRVQELENERGDTCQHEVSQTAHHLSNTSTAAPTSPLPASEHPVVPTEPSGEQKCGHKPAYEKNYHLAFNHKNFIRWWKHDLLPNLKQPSLIIMDNAAYHRCRAEGTPNPSQMRKSEVEAALRERGVPFGPGFEYADDLKDKLRAWIQEHIPLETVRLAEAEGHKVLWTPPYYSDLNPIELCWALVKGNIARQHDSDTTLSIVRQRLQEEIDRLNEDSGQYRADGRTLVDAIIASTDTHVMRFHRSFLTDEDEGMLSSASGSRTGEREGEHAEGEMARFVHGEEIDWREVDEDQHILEGMDTLALEPQVEAEGERAHHTQQEMESDDMDDEEEG